MGCGCKERAAALKRATSAAIGLDGRTVTRELEFVGRTLRQDIRSGALTRAALARTPLLHRLRRR